MVMNNMNKIKQIVLLGGDIFILYFALYLTLCLRYLSLPDELLWQIHFVPFTIIFFFWLIIFYITGLYSLHTAANNTKFFEITWKSLTISSLLAVAFFYLSPQTNIAPKTNLLIYVFVFAILFYGWRHLYNKLLHVYLPKENIAVIGYNQQVKELVEELEQKPQLGFNLKFIVDEKLEADEIHQIKIIKSIKELKNIISSEKITTIIFSSDPHQSDDLRLFLFELLPLNIKYMSLSNFYENITGKVPVDVINQMWFLENLNIGEKRGFEMLKRASDLSLAILLLAISIIFWPFIGLVIIIESRGGILFRQVRSGQNNSPFSILKFRTMTSTNNDYSPTAVNDKRITKFGNFLRKSRIDEIPQLINIIKGEMSFVGPRPERPELIADLEKQIPFYKERMLVKPGVTGWDQISGEYHSPSFEDSLKKLQYDLFYIKNRSFYLDLSIVLKTIKTVILQSGR